MTGKDAGTSRYDTSLIRALGRAFVPIWVLSPLVLLLPTTPPEAGFFGLEWYQQIVSVSVLPALIWSFYRFGKIQEAAYQTPEERVLNE